MRDFVVTQKNHAENVESIGVHWQQSESEWTHESEASLFPMCTMLEQLWGAFSLE